MSKGQIITMDFFTAALIFFLLITISLITLYTYPIRLTETQIRNEMLINALQISDSLVKSPGTPSSWEDNASSVETIGLADSDRILSEKKVNQFVNLSYNQSLSLLSFYNFYFRLINSSNHELVTYGNKTNGTTAVSIRRYVLYNNAQTTMELTLWK